MLPSLRHSTRAARAVAPHRWLERTSAGSIRLLYCQPRWVEGGRRLFSRTLCRHQQAVADSTAHTSLSESHLDPVKKTPEGHKLPIVCPGCGAPSQTVDAEAAGYYGEKRRKRITEKLRRKEENEVFEKAIQNGALQVDKGAATPEPSPAGQEVAQRCDRCHFLQHHGMGDSIIHPTMQSIQSMIEESPHRHNHIYHVLDAADFPMSLIPKLTDSLDLPRLRTQNRRSKSLRYVRGRVAEVSFIITRSDLLAPQKEQVDKMMHYFQECLRDALGRSGAKARLGNIRCVSSKRGWWTRNVKEDIYRQGGAGWMVGKVNVGKSALFESVYPKGRGQRRVAAETKFDVDKTPTSNSVAWGSGEVDPFEEADPDLKEQNSVLDSKENPVESEQLESEQLESEQEVEVNNEQAQEPEQDDLFDEDDDGSLLPPAQPEIAYPEMPLVSSLPGTTVSPIRVPFGRGKGELIDLPGIHRSSLDIHIKPEYRNGLVMESRVTPEQHSVKPGQSLLLGGAIRITPKTDDLVFLMYPFLPPALNPHVTATDKAIAIQTGVHPETSEPYSGTVPSISTEGAKQSISSAGTFKLEWDVTKRRAGPVTSRSDGKMKSENLPFTVYSADLLIEGVGWVELVAQVRRRRDAADPFAEMPGLPEVEVFSPKGKFVGVRRPMNAWLLGGQLKKPVHAQRPRPRQTVSFQKRKSGGR